MTSDAVASLTPPPPEVSSFVGRRDEISELRALLGSARLVTICGPGGVGKTRLAIRVAVEARRAFPDGVCFVDLSASGSLEQTIEFLSVALRVGDASLDAVVRRLGEHRILLVIDNCEQVIEACATIAATIVARCPDVVLLTTSREPLALDAERIYPVTPLRVEADDTGVSPAVDLFVSRARALDPGFDPGDGRSTLFEICGQLDGLPLAIELAAAWTRILSLADILQRLEEPFRLLGGAARIPSARQRTLYASIEWSYELCTEDERRLWRHLAVFPGGFDIAAAETVAASSDGRADALELLRALVDKSIISKTPGLPHTRYSMLFAIREFGIEQARAEGEIEAAERLLSQWCTAFLDTAEQDWFSPRQFDWIARHELEMPNIRVAIDLALGPDGDPDAAFGLLIPMWRVFWLARGRARDLEKLLDRALSATTGTHPLRLSARLLHDYIVGSRLGLDAVADELRRLTIEAEAVGDEWTARSVDAGVGVLMPDGPAAAALLERAVAYGAQNLLMLTRTGAHIRLALLHDRLGNTERAAELRDTILSRSEQTGEMYDRAYLLFGLAVDAIERHDAEEALHFATTSLRMRRRLSPSALTAHTVEAVAAASFDTGRAGDAARCIGIADSIWSATGVRRDDIGLPTTPRDAYERRIRDALPERDFAVDYEKGRDASPAAGLDWVLGVDGSAAAAPTRVDTDADLTKREREVARLVAAGRSNKEIATTLVVAVRTAEGHVQRILNKLGLSSRVQLAGWVRDHLDAEGTTEDR
ncbi:LuxR family transcriptional regulator [Leifsonia lichenia]